MSTDPFAPSPFGGTTGSSSSPVRGGDPDRIGAFRLPGVQGEGVMGVVHRTEQEAPARRRAALEIIKLGPDRREARCVQPAH
jgi:hypothetical protein